MQNQNIAIIGSTGGIGAAFANHLRAGNTLYEFSRSTGLDYTDESTIQSAAATIDAPLDIILITTGFLHDEAIKPEKALRELSREKFEKNFLINTIGPALVMKHFLPKLTRENRAVCAALSARVGSISDNALGGWTAYRAAKAALNMVIKNAAIETARTRKNAIIIALHPGTVDTGLSRPFQGGVPDKKLFTAENSSKMMLEILQQRTPADSGKIFAWDGEEIAP